MLGNKIKILNESSTGTSGSGLVDYDAGMTPDSNSSDFSEDSMEIPF